MSEHDPKLYFRVAFLALLLHFASGDCVNLDLGMERGSIPDSNITASSEINANTTAKNGRLNFRSGSSWCAGTNDSNPYLQIDLQTLHIICAVSTQGNSQADQWVKTYKLKLSTNGSTWTDYKEGGQVKSLTGNEDKNSEVKHILYEGVLARYLQFLPETHHGGVCLRTELFGVKLNPENLALGKPTAQSSTLSNEFVGDAVSGRAVDGNPDTNMRNKHCSQTKKLNNPSWWRVDLGSDYVPVSQIYIVNRFSPGDPTESSKDYEITLGRSADVTTNSKCTGRYTFIKFKASAVCFTNPLRTGRYVGIKTTKSQALQLCEVEIYSRENLAFDKQTNQSSTDFGGVSRRAVDGKSATAWGANSCTHTAVEDKAWWIVDLGKGEHVTEVYIVNRDIFGDRLSNFEIRVGKISDHGGVTNPECGSGYSVPEGRGLSFFCRPPLYGRYVTIRNLQMNAPLTLCEVEVYSERRACPMQSIGVASRDAFPDSSFSASSTRSGNDAFKGRLYGDGAWSPNDNNNAKDYLQIDLLYEFVICAVATQGKTSADHWTKTYKLQLSFCGSHWVIYQENNVDKVFNGNSGRNDTVKHSLKEYASARFIRFQPTTYETHKALRVEVFGILVSTVPSQAPSGFTVAASSSTSISASWYLPPENARHGNITGFKLFYKKKDSVGSPLNVTINGGGNHTEDIAGLAKYTEYEFQVLAFTSVGDGPKSSVVVERTKEDAPDVPATLNHTNIAPDKSHGPKVNLTWSEPIRPNGIIRSYALFYGHEKDTQKETFGNDTLSYSVDVLGGLTYQFYVRAVTIKPGLNASVTVNVPEYVPSVGPDNVSFSVLNETTFNISWAPLTREKSHGKVILYDVKEELLSRGRRRKRSPISSRTLNTTATFVVLYDLPLFSQYHVFVRAYTKVGPGPYIQPMVLETSSKPFIRDLPERTILAVGEQAVLTCEVSGNPEPSVKWSKDGDTNIPRAQFKDDGRILAIKDVLPIDSGMYECRASNKWGESRSSTTVVIAVPPSVSEDISSSSVICEMQTLCTLSCHATSDSPFNYSWTKNGQVPVGDDIKIMNNIIALTPRDAEDYGVYVCHATNSFGSAAYKITVSEGHKSSTSADLKRTFNATVITLSCIVFVLLVVNGLMIWRARRALPNNRATTAADKAITDSVGKPDSPHDEQVSEPGLYMELHPRPSEGRSRATPEYMSIQGINKNSDCYNVGFKNRGSEGKLVSPHGQHASEPATYMDLQPRPSKGQSQALPEYKSLQGRNKNPGYYNVGFNKGNKRNEQGQIYDEAGNAHC